MSEPRPSMIDPYRTLGLEAGASMPDVKRAYRRLAKAYHPDSAGEAALPRFLAVHEAYEAIRTGRPMMSGRGAPWASTSRGATGGPSAEPWRADPNRARAAREQARRRTGADTGARTGGPGGASRGASGGAGASSAGAGSARTGRTGTSGDARGGAGSRAGSGSGRGRRHVRKATLGSTSYDEARDPRDPNDPSWSGASWYGPSTGEYWIINPREYADPRKHGPEYQSRARRMAAAAAAGETDGESRAAEDVDATVDATAEPPTAGGEAAWTFETASRRAPGPGAASSAQAAASSASTASATSTYRPARPTPDGWTGAGRLHATRLPGDAERRGRNVAARPLSARELVGAPSDDPVRRLGIALVAWPPIGLVAAALIGDATGCASFAATCNGTEPLLPWLAQAVILGSLLLLPAIARLLAGGAIGVLVALVPMTAFLVAVGGTGAPQAGFALAVLLGGAWLLGIAWALVQLRPRRRVGGAR